MQKFGVCDDEGDRMTHPRSVLPSLSNEHPDPANGSPHQTPGTSNSCLHLGNEFGDVHRDGARPGSGKWFAGTRTPMSAWSNRVTR
jgi:hypothetical protein